MTRSLRQRGRERGSRMVHIMLPFDDIMEFALALLALTPGELEALGRPFADRKRLLDHFLVSGKNVQGRKIEDIARMPIELALPQRDVDRLQHFARRELPKAVSNAGVIDRVLNALDHPSRRSPQRMSAQAAPPGRQALTA